MQVDKLETWKKTGDKSSVDVLRFSDASFRKKMWKKAISKKSASQPVAAWK
jgi:hypothetical protein